MSNSRYQPVYRDKRLHVCAQKCSTCIYRPGNLMYLQPGRKESMEQEAVACEGVIPCHKTLGDEPAICRGYWDTQKRHVGLLQAAERLGIVKEVEPDAAG